MTLTQPHMYISIPDVEIGCFPEPLKDSLSLGLCYSFKAFQVTPTRSVTHLLCWYLHVAKKWRHWTKV